ncbi:unnamed protein product [Somion occarium]|uniref:Uracil-DNA glycosylase-like domain-containing protein n=1 Tax=Somion occarium TaxID=3059160 RepID=A0ABP1DN75_9APHY
MSIKTLDSPEKLKASLETFKFTSPLRRSARNHSSVKQEPDVEESLSTSDNWTVLTTSGLPEIKQDIEPLLSLTIPSTPRKRKLKQESAGSSPRAKKPKRGFAPPEQYAHLNFLQDYLKENLDVMFCGVNPGCMSAKVGHHFANPTNHFWRCLHRSELTDRLLPAAEDFTLPQAYNLGLTNLVDRPSAEQAELSKQDMIFGVPVLLSKIARFRPRIITFVGKGIWEVFIKEASKLIPVLESTQDDETSASSGSTTPITDDGDSATADKLPSKQRQTTKRKGKSKGKKSKKSTFDWGIQPYKAVHGTAYEVTETLFFVMPSTSGRVVSHQLNDKVKIFAALRDRIVEAKNASIETSAMKVIPLPNPKQ